MSAPQQSSTKNDIINLALYVSVHVGICVLGNLINEKIKLSRMTRELKAFLADAKKSRDSVDDKKNPPGELGKDGNNSSSNMRKRMLDQLFFGKDGDKSSSRTSSVEERLINIMKKQRHGRQKKNDSNQELPLSLNLTKEEEEIAQDVIDPDDIDSSFVNIGGLDELKQEIWELVVLPIRKPQLFQGSSATLVKKVSGAMLYGKPGCGKTLLAKAIAKESGAIFISPSVSRLLQKYVGESEHLVSATFSLARKVAPSVIFIDEMDSIFSDKLGNAKYLDNIKKTFLTEMDGISSSKCTAGPPVVVFGATNKPQKIDPAILRRLPRTFHIPLPNEQGRLNILNILLQGQAMDDSAKAFLPTLSKDDLTEGYSGSDLKELCCAAAMEPIREACAEEAKRAVFHGSLPATKIGTPPLKDGKDSVAEKTTELVQLEQDGEEEASGHEDIKEQSPDETDGVDNDNCELPSVRPVSEKDFRTALEKVKKTGKTAKDYDENESAPSTEVRNSIYS